MFANINLLKRGEGTRGPIVGEISISKLQGPKFVTFIINMGEILTL